MNSIIIGDNTRFNSGYSNYVGGEGRTALQTGEKGKIVIGANVGISNATIVCQTSITIEDYVFIGGGVKLYDNDFHSTNFYERINHPTFIPSAPIHIKKGAFIGGHSIILKGVTIGEYAVIGAGSIVTKNIPSKELWAGVPAKKLKDL
jgi:acetyltransferase-like isoleucine patch superfamily enzyme